MDTSDLLQLIFLLLLLALSAFFSGAETALTTVNKIRMRSLSESGDKRADQVLKVTDNSPKMLSAILIGNNLVNISASSLATTLATRLFGNMGAGIAIGVLTLLILIFGEVTPKNMANIKAESFSLAIAGVVGVLMWVLTPVIFIINFLSRAVMLLFGVRPEDADETITEEELRTIVDVSQEAGVLEEEEHEIINNVFDFGDAKAKEVMVPRIDMTFIPADATYDDLMETFRQVKFTRYPVYEDTTDTIIGTINIKDVFLGGNKEHFCLKDYLREPVFTYEHMNTADLFLEMRQSSTSVVIVLDEYGATAGMITLEDLLEEIVGEIRDEYDTDEVDDITALSDREYLVNGSANLEDVSQKLGVSFSSEDYDSLGGYVLSLLDHVPEEKESITTPEGITLRVESMDKNRIEKVYICLPQSQAAEDPSKTL